MPLSLVPPPAVTNGPSASNVPPQFVCSWTDAIPGTAWMHVVGELDIDTTPVLERTLSHRQSEVKMVVLDLSDLTFIDSSGVHAIVSATVHAQELGRRLLLVRGRPKVDRLFTLTRSSSDVEYV